MKMYVSIFKGMRSTIPGLYGMSLTHFQRMGREHSQTSWQQIQNSLAYYPPGKPSPSER